MAAGSDQVSPLTPRQAEIAGLIARGLTNQEIAAETGLSQGTVANHVEHILRKLQLRSRTQIAVWAIEQGLRPGESERRRPPQGRVR